MPSSGTHGAAIDLVLLAGRTANIYGRDAEMRRIRLLLDGARGGRGGCVVVRGEPGIGKTALLDYAASEALDLRVIRANGAESEMELPFATLQQACASIADGLENLQSGFRDALATALGRSAGRPPDRFLVALAMLSLLSEVGGRRPLVFIVDDAQWLDGASAQTLAFVARRLLADPVALIFATRDDGENEADALRGLPAIELRGLRDRDARALIDSVIGGPLDERIRDRIVSETRGNPLALLELPRELTAEDLGSYRPSAAMPPVRRVEDRFRRRFEALPADTRLLLLLAAAEPIGEPLLIWRAAALLDIDTEAASPGIDAGLIEFGARVRFRHPLVRSAIYRSCSLRDRRIVHGALADATDATVDPDRRAWHRAESVAEPNEDVAAELERSAGRARSRGGHAAAAAFLERATALSLNPVKQSQRALAAAESKYQVGAYEAASSLLTTAVSQACEPDEQARREMLKARIASALNRGADAPAILLTAGQRLRPLDKRLAREMYLDALTAALSADGPVAYDQLAEIAGAVLSVPRPDRGASSIGDLLIDGIAADILGDRAKTIAGLSTAVSAALGEAPVDGLRWLRLAIHAAVSVWDDDAWEILTVRYLRSVRSSGALSSLPGALSARAIRLLVTGRLCEAATCAQEAQTMLEATGARSAPHMAAAVSVFRGEPSNCFEPLLKSTGAHRHGMETSFLAWVAGVAYNGLAMHEEVIRATEAALDRHHVDTFAIGALLERVEALAHCGRRDEAEDIVAHVAALSGPVANPWSAATEARLRALVEEGDSANAHYAQAIERFSRTQLRFELARSHLLYGEFLLRERHRAAARDHLQTAHELFADMGAQTFATRTARELISAGDRAPTQHLDQTPELTSQESQIARLVCQGLSNAQIGERLFVSASTVAYHLRKVFVKLGVRSRTELADILNPYEEPDETPLAEPRAPVALAAQMPPDGLRSDRLSSRRPSASVS